MFAHSRAPGNSICAPAPQPGGPGFGPSSRPKGDERFSRVPTRLARTFSGGVSSSRSRAFCASPDSCRDERFMRVPTRRDESPITDSAASKACFGPFSPKNGVMELALSEVEGSFVDSRHRDPPPPAMPVLTRRHHTKRLMEPASAVAEVSGGTRPREIAKVHAEALQRPA